MMWKAPAACGHVTKNKIKRVTVQFNMNFSDVTLAEFSFSLRHRHTFETKLTGFAQ